MPDNDDIIPSASVKVMRSYDYCHFEIALGTVDVSLKNVDEMRKVAARLADKAVEQYKIAKANQQAILHETSQRDHLRSRAERIRQMAETDRSPEQQAELKAFEDDAWQASREYDYQDDWT